MKVYFSAILFASLCIVIISCAKKTAEITIGETQETEEKIVIRYNNPVNPGGPHWQRMEMIKSFIEESHSRIEVQLYTDLVQQGTSVTSIARGTIDMAFASLSMMAKVDSSYDVFTKAYNFRNPDHANVVLRSDIMNDLNTTFAKKIKLKMLAPNLAGVRHLNLRKNRDVQSPNDLAGAKLRVVNAPAFLWMAAST